MIDTLRFVLTFGTALGTGLIAGVFFAFSSFIMQALNRLPPHTAIAAMQSINIVVINPRFMAAFVGTALACVLLIVDGLVHLQHPGARWIVVGAGLYLLGSFGVTMVGNVPLNNTLAHVAPGAPDAAAQWADYAARWMLWNHVRGGAALAAAAVLTIALLAAAPGTP